MAKTRDRVSDAADTVKPYVDRALHDQDLRDNVKNAFESARAVYNELIGGRGPVAVGTRVATDKDLQKELKRIVDELREAADRVQGRREHAARNSSLLLVGIVLGLLFNPLTGPQTRKWLSDHVFGGGDEFTYQGGGNGAGTSS